MRMLDPMSLQRHSDRFLKMAFSAKRRKKIKNPDAYGRNTGDCGDTVEVFLKVTDGRLKSVSYRVDGCIHTNACAATVAQMAEGRSGDDAWEITPEKVIRYLKSLPKQNTHCAELAVGALYLALSAYEQTE
jgi:nitrogen fixation protein NifU and related proteins